MRTMNRMLTMFTIVMTLALGMAGCDNKKAEPTIMAPANLTPPYAPTAPGFNTGLPAQNFGPGAQSGVPPTPTVDTGIRDCDYPSFSLAWSEYPSWSTYGVASNKGLISGERGKCGPVERKYGVDVELKEMEYDPSLAAYASGAVDAVTITNMDVLSPALGRPSVAIMPTSTSYGADAVIVPKTVTDPAQLKGVPVRGLQKSVSEYLFVRGLERLGKNPAEYKMENMDPGAAAVAMQQKQPGVDAIVVWNPFVLDTLGKRDDVHVLYDSTLIPAEIVDMVVVAQASLDKPGGEAFAHAAIETYYRVNKLLADPATRDDTLIAIGEKFSDLGLEAMRKVVEQTLFYATPADGAVLFTDGTSFPWRMHGGLPAPPKFRSETMPRVVDFCLAHGIVDKKPNVGYGSKTEAPGVDVRFDHTYMDAVKSGL